MDSAQSDETLNPANKTKDDAIIATESTAANSALALAQAAATAAKNYVIDPNVSTFADLQTALAAAPTDGTSYVINIENNITATTALDVATGTNVTIQADSSLSSPVTLIDPNGITVEGALTLGNNLIVDGTGDASQTPGITVTGTLNLTGAVIQNYTGYWGGGIFVDGGTFNLTSGTISNNSGVYGGGVLNYLGTVNMSGGTISNNSAAYYGGGILDWSGTVNLTGGNITDNTTPWWGGGIYLLQGATLTQSGGSINNNTANNNGGGLYVDSTSTATLTSGTIDNNTALSYNSDNTVNGSVDTTGGGVYNVGTFTLTDGEINRNTALNGGGVDIEGAFTMSGGSVSNNSALQAVGSISGIGGGLLINTDNATLNSGTISGNTAGNVGGGIYLADNKSLYLTNVLDDNNTATNGGGIWECPLGHVYEYVTDGAAIYGNTATAGSMAYLEPATQGQSATIDISNGTLGGGSQTVALNNSDGTTTAISLPTELTNTSATDSLNLSNNLDSTSASLAVSLGTLVISNNNAIGGGGIATNGLVVIGNPDTTNVTITKTWNLPTGESIPSSVTFNLLATPTNGGATVTLEQVTLSAADNWTETITGLPSGTYTYSFSETGSTYDASSSESTTSTTATGNYPSSLVQATGVSESAGSYYSRTLTLIGGNTAATYELYGVDGLGINEDLGAVTLSPDGNGNLTYTWGLTAGDNSTNQEQKVLGLSGTYTDFTLQDASSNVIANTVMADTVSGTQTSIMQSGVSAATSYELFGTDSSGNLVDLGAVTLQPDGSDNIIYSWLSTNTDAQSMAVSSGNYSDLALYTVVPGASYSDTTTNMNFNVTNTDDLQQIKITKNWDLPAGEAIPTSANFSLYGVAADGTETKIQDLTLTSAENWTTTISGLPLNLYNHYTLVENQTGTDYDVVISENQDTTDANQIDFTATNKDDEQSIEITKTWDLPEGYMAPTSANFTVYGVADDGTKTKIEDVTLTANENWTTTITGLPLYLYNHYILVENQAGTSYDVTISESQDTTNANQMDFGVVNTLEITPPTTPPISPEPPISPTPPQPPVSGHPVTPTLPVNPVSPVTPPTRPTSLVMPVSPKTPTPTETVKPAVIGTKVVPSVNNVPIVEANILPKTGATEESWFAKLLGVLSLVLSALILGTRRKKRN